VLTQGRHTEALARSEVMLAGSPDCTDALVLRGAALKALGQYAEAVTAFEDWVSGGFVQNCTSS
jgi:Tetratricopeptide repeat